MKIKLSENIRALRRERKMTQEQLAEAMGVTIGAVSKWESGASTPDVGLIADMADFFETSVDVLLGYVWRENSMGRAVERLRALRNQKRFAEGRAEAERSLLKYPNCFDVVYQCAILYSMDGIERQAQKSFRRALELSERSLELIGQNENPRISAWTIRNNIADLYQSLGQTQKALELLKQNNADGMNEDIIGYTLAVTLRKPEEALPHLSDALTDHAADLSRVVIGYANAYAEQKRYADALDVLGWCLGLVDGLRKPESLSYMDKALVQLLTGCAVIAMLNGDTDASRAYLRRARDEAARFDAAPRYDFTGMRFYHGDGSAFAFDDFGATATAGVEKAIGEEEAVADKLKALWEQMNKADAQAPADGE